MLPVAYALAYALVLTLFLCSSEKYARCAVTLAVTVVVIFSGAPSALSPRNIDNAGLTDRPAALHFPAALPYKNH